MSIPHTIHYCWFGKNPIPKKLKKYIDSWKKYCPDYEIIRWDESNFDVSQNRYMQEAYDASKWAFVTDVARLEIIYRYGGVYLDTDVELLKPIDDLLKDGPYLGRERSGLLATGLGFAAEAGNPVIYELLKDYGNVSFRKEDGSLDLTSCPERNTKALERLLGRKITDSVEVLNVQGVRILPCDYLCPMDYMTEKITVTPNTYSIHHYAASWHASIYQVFPFLDRLKKRIRYRIGEEKYAKLTGGWRKEGGNKGK